MKKFLCHACGAEITFRFLRVGDPVRCGSCEEQNIVPAGARDDEDTQDQSHDRGHAVGDLPPPVGVTPDADVPESPSQVFSHGVRVLMIGVILCIFRFQFATGTFVFNTTIVGYILTGVAFHSLWRFWFLRLPVILGYGVVGLGCLQNFLGWIGMSQAWILDPSFLASIIALGLVYQASHYSPALRKIQRLILTGFGGALAAGVGGLILLYAGETLMQIYQKLRDAPIVSSLYTFIGFDLPLMILGLVQVVLTIYVLYQVRAEVREVPKVFDDDALTGWTRTADPT